VKKIVFLAIMAVIISCTQAKPVIGKGSVKIDSTEYYKGKYDSISFLASQYEKFLISYENDIRIKHDSIRVLQDSIVKLNCRPLMTKAQFLELYKYERLLKYYKICKNKPTQWKFYKGWTTRVFEQ